MAKGFIHMVVMYKVVSADKATYQCEEKSEVGLLCICCELQRGPVCIT